MLARLHSFVLQGIDAVACEVEADLSPVGLPKTTVVGLPDAAVREAVERVRTAILNGGFRYPTRRLTINLAPADIRKEGPVYDLPIALAILEADATVVAASDAASPRDYLVAGELALDGRTRPIRGGISVALLARRLGKRGVIVPAATAPEAATVSGIEVIGVAGLDEAVGHLNGTRVIAPHPALDSDSAAAAPAIIDFGDVRGQEGAKRALTVAAAGAHNVLLIGPAGTGKTMMAKALPGILPPLTREEAIEVTQVHSCAGVLRPEAPLIRARPVRSPHHTASSAAIIGGGSVPRPGEVSLAHRGVLFLDEMPEFSRNVLETLRQPLEDGAVTIARVHGSVRFPARFMLVAALNPTAQGGDGGGERSGAMQRYLSRMSGPLVDRIDIHVEVPAVAFRDLTGSRRGTDTASMESRVRAARARQRARQGGRTNAELGGRHLDELVPLDLPARALLQQAMTELGLSARAYDRIRRVARTIADLDDAADVEPHHVAEAVQYRLLDRLHDGGVALGGTPGTPRRPEPTTR